jgi:dienelactone hydrolase
MRLRTRPAISAGVLLLLLLVVSYAALRDHLRASAFVVKAAGMQGAARTAAEWEAGDVVELRNGIPWRQGVLPSRIYQPSRRRGRVFLLVPGVHASGVEEPRLVGFARDLASMGHVVVTAGPPDLATYSITPTTTDAIEDAARWVAAQPELAPDGRVGMMGISFSGGLSIVAAGRPALRDKVAGVLSLGGHGDLARTLRYLCTGEQPDGTVRPPHDYGVVIILLSVADRVVPKDQVPAFKDAVLMFLEASRLDLVNRELSLATFKKASLIGDTLPEPSRTLMAAVNRRDVAMLGPLLLPHVGSLGDARALSPEHAPPPAATVFLLHGADDNVIPAAESILLARAFEQRRLPARLLATPLITHAEVDRASSTMDIWRLVSFWKDVLDD